MNTSVISQDPKIKLNCIIETTKNSLITEAVNFFNVACSYPRDEATRFFFHWDEVEAVQKVYGNPMNSLLGL